MTRLRFLVAVIAASQLVLGLLTLFAPGAFVEAMGLARPPTDNQYMLGMLASRFLAYGLVLAHMARTGIMRRSWLAVMILIQAIDFAVGAYYLSIGVIAPDTAAFPMINAFAFALLLGLWLPRSQPMKAKPERF